MSLWMRLSVRQNLWQSLSIELKHSLVQRFKDATKVLRWKAYKPEDEILIIDTLVDVFLWKIYDQEVKSMMKVIFDDNKIKQMMIEDCVLLSMPKKGNINNFIYKYIFSTILDEQNKLEKQGQMIDEEDKLKPFHEKIFIKAIEKRNELEQEIEQIRELIRTNWNQATWLLEDFWIKNNILNIVDENMVKLIETLSGLFEFLLNTKIKKEEENAKGNQDDVLWFLREKVILNEITTFSSERLLKRFLANLPSFSNRTELNNCKDLKHRTINVIWEFMLISLGIISPEMFKLQKFTIDPEKINDLLKETNSTIEELEHLFKYYNLRWVNWSPIFYNRWFTKNHVPSKEVDQLIKDFLLKINEHKEEILMKFGYKEFEKSIIESKRDKDLNHEEKEESIVKALNERIADEKFIQEMVKILSNYRYKQIYQLINPPK